MVQSGAAVGGRDAVGRSAVFLLVFAACGIGILIRGLRYYDIFTPHGEILLGIDDSMFHARRALYSFVNFPAALGFDWYLAFPTGAAAPVPPLFDWLTAGVARLFGNDVRTFETVAAWVSPVAGGFFSLGAYSIGRSLGSRWVGLAAAALVLVLPSGQLVTRLGNFDHHGVVALIAAAWLASSLGTIGRTGRPLMWMTFAQGVVVSSMLFTWSGSLLYVLIGAGAQLFAILLLHGRPDRLAATAASLLVPVLPVSIWLSLTPPPLGGALSSQTLSWLHVLALLCIAGSVLGLVVWEARKPSASAPARIGRLAMLGLAVGLPLIAIPAIREQLFVGLSFVAQQDDWATTNPEQFPLFHDSTQAASATRRLGYLAYIVPLLPLYLAWSTYRAHDREKLVVFTLWVGALTFLLLTQVRYGTDYTMPGAVAMILLFDAVRRAAAARMAPMVAAIAVTAVMGVALTPAITWFHWPQFYAAWLELGRDDEARRATPMTLNQVAVRFGHAVRRATPDVRGFLDSSVRPEYGVLVRAATGHRFIYASRRPTPANNLGPYLDEEKWRLSRAFYETPDPNEAFGVLQDLSVRYFVTIAPRPLATPFAAMVHHTNDSAVEGRPSSGHIRLVTVSDPIELPVHYADGTTSMRPRIYFKLFEAVQGALLVVEAPPRESVTAQIGLEFESGRTIRHRAIGLAGPDGIARLRVPYSSGYQGAVSTPGLWQVRVGDEVLQYEVSEADVHGGREVRASSRSTLPAT